MIELKRKLKLRLADEAGFSIMEVLVALIVFSVVAVGIAYSLTNALRLTQDARSREVAIHLAAQEIDKIRSLEDIFQVLASTETYTVDGADYDVTREPVWDNSAGDAIQCGALSGGSDSFEFKRVQIEVDWDGRRTGSSKVYSDTIISPNRRITDPTLGTILISVINAAGSGSAGIAVQASPDGGGAQTPPEPIPATDSEGCSYVLKVTPGQYLMKVSKLGYVDVNQNVDDSSRTVTVGAGELKSLQFQFDEAARFDIQYAANYTDPVVLPNSTPVTAVNTYGNFSFSGTPLWLHPFSSGYELIAGAYAPASSGSACISPDPAQWPDAPDGAVGSRGPIHTGAPGDTVTAPANMGVVRISLNGTRQVRARSVDENPGTDDPGCEEDYTVVFPNQSAGSTDLALPFGTWEIQTRWAGSWSTLKTTTPGDKLIEVRTRGQIDDSLVLMDPREVP